MELIEEKGAYHVMRNTSKLTTKEFSESKVIADTTEEAERMIIEEHLGQSTALCLPKEKEKELVTRLMITLDAAKQEGEKQSDYESRLTEEMTRIIEDL